ncbi:MAG: 50S ribosomal protein L11 methyltransferase [Desulfomonile sp.]|nr:50S ribosomal protein L11 methyltransferase [Desulfomonile sp.]
MIHPDTLLYVYEVPGDRRDVPPAAPATFIGLWNEDECTYFFFSGPEEEYVRSVVCSNSSIPHSVHEVHYRDWQDGLPREGLTVAGVQFVPSDMSNPPRDAVLLDPSVAFGDASHPTTLSCLRAMGRVFRMQTVNSFLDLGTGTGILALAAVRMGARRVLAVDRNVLAVNTARKNVEANSLCGIIMVREGDVRHFFETRYDLVAANLPFHVLREICVLDGANSHRTWVVSGISKNQGRTLVELFSEQGYRLIYEWADPPWVTFVVSRPSPPR